MKVNTVATVRFEPGICFNLLPLHLFFLCIIAPLRLFRCAHSHRLFKIKEENLPISNFTVCVALEIASATWLAIFVVTPISNFILGIKLTVYSALL